MIQELGYCSARELPRYLSGRAGEAADLIDYLPDDALLILDGPCYCAADRRYV